MKYLFHVYDELQFNADLVYTQRLRISSNFVPGSGSLVPRAILIGEAPGANENKQRRPFVGRSGAFLDGVLANSGILRSDVFITNIVKYQPPGNRDPLPEEIAESLPYLRRELSLVGVGAQVKLIVGMGKIACSTILNEEISVTNYRGRIMDIKNGWKMMVTYHPSFVLRSARGPKMSLVEQQFRSDFGMVGEYINRQVA